jgi:hypothetical protein
MRDPTPRQAEWRRQVVARIYTRAASQVYERSGDRFGHDQGPWSPFDNTGSFQDLFRAVMEIGTRQLAIQNDQALSAAHLDNVQIAACALAVRGLHNGRASFEATIASAHAGAAELESQREGLFRTAFDPADVRMVYEVVAGQAPRLGPDGVVRPSIGSGDPAIFPGGVQFELAQQLLADAVACWLAQRAGLRWGLMWFLQTEEEGERVEPVHAVSQLDRVQVDPERVRRFLQGFHHRLDTQQFYLRSSRRMFRAGQRLNRAVCDELGRSFDRCLDRGHSPAEAFHRIVLEAEEFARSGSRPRPRPPLGND